MVFEDQLKELGLNKSEISVYLFLLKSGVATPADVSRGTNITRTNCYHVLRDLKEKQLIRERVQGSKKTFLANHPAQLSTLIEKKRQNLINIIPELVAVFQQNSNKLLVSYGEGIDGLSSLFAEISRAPEVIIFGSLITNSQDLITLLEKFTNLLRQNDKIAHFGANVQLPNIFIFWDNNVTILPLSEPLCATTISNSPFATSLKTVFFSNVSHETLHSQHSDSSL